MRNKFLLLLLLSFFLTSCFWGQETISSDGLILHEESRFSINIPNNWNIITQKDNILPKPRSWEIALAVTSDELMYGFSNNLLILEQDLQKLTTSDEFSILNNVWASRDYDEYLQLSSKIITFADSDRATLYTFEAKYTQATPKFKYLQVWKVCSYSKWYLLTIAISTDVKDISPYERILSSFKCR